MYLNHHISYMTSSALAPMWTWSWTNSVRPQSLFWVGWVGGRSLLLRIWNVCETLEEFLCIWDVSYAIYISLMISKLLCTKGCLESPCLPLLIQILRSRPVLRYSWMRQLMFEEKCTRIDYHNIKGTEQCCCKVTTVTRTHDFRLFFKSISYTRWYCPKAQK